LSLTKGEISNGGSNCGTNTETNANAPWEKKDYLSK
jgi:hypothetical protein